MRLREREMPLDPEVERELDAIDRAIAREPVDPDLEPLAELARALREERVDAEPGFAANLDQQVAEGFPRPGALAGSQRLAKLREKLTVVPPRRILARAGAAATALVVVGVTIGQSGEIWGGEDGSFSTRPAPDQRVGVRRTSPSAAGADPDGGAPAGRDALGALESGGKAGEQAAGAIDGDTPNISARQAARVDLGIPLPDG